MSRGLAVLLGVGAGCLVGMQAPINSRLGKTVGSIEAATISFLVGTVALVLILLIARGGLGGIGRIGRAPWWALVGGLLGAVYVSVALVAVRTLGASGLTAVVISRPARDLRADRPLRPARGRPSGRRRAARRRSRAARGRRGAGGAQVARGRFGRLSRALW